MRLSHALWILADETHGQGSVSERIKSLASQFGLAEHALTCFRYTEGDMMKAFDTVSEVQAALPDTQDVKDCFTHPCRKSMAWGCHVEALLLWWRHVADSPLEPTAIWVIEDDAGYSGDLANFVEAYSCESADLIAHGLQRARPDWVWNTTATRSFLETAMPEARLRCAEHVQRLSARMLRALHQYCEDGISAWSEMSAPTLCRLAGMEYASLRPEHVGSIFVFDGKVSQAMWEAICARSDLQNKWWHALKW